MGKWIATGADLISGKMRNLAIVAVDATDAERQATSRGLLVAHVKPAGESMEYSPPPDGVPEPPARTYDDIVAGARVLVYLATVLAGLSNLCFIAAAGTIVVGGYLATRSGQGSTPFSVALVYGLSFAMYGLGLRVVSSVLRLFSSLSMAVRDLARNSFESR